MSAFSLVQTTDRNTNQLQSNIAQALNPLLNNALLQGSIIKGVSLSVGSNSVNHGLNRKLQGWIIIRKRASSDIYDTQDSNSSPDKTLQLTASVAVTVDLYCF